MPATSRGLLERDRLGMPGQVRVVITGYVYTAAVHLVTGYMVLLAGAVLRRQARRVVADAEIPKRSPRAAGVPEGVA